MKSDINKLNNEKIVDPSEHKPYKMTSISDAREKREKKDFNDTMHSVSNYAKKLNW